MIGVLLSVGVDSLAMLDMATQKSMDVLAIYINWGQPAHWYEDTASIKICQHYGVPRKVINAGFLMSNAMHAGAGAPGPRVVKGRNLAFISMALAAVPGLTQIWLGAVKDDYDDYMDCRPAYVMQLNALIAHSGVHVRAPLIRSTKKEIHDYCQLENVPLELAWSCYEAQDGKPCKTCDSCKSNNPTSWR